MRISKIIIISSLIICTTFTYAQCTTLDQISNSNEVEEACVLYRDHLKNNNTGKALSYWTRVYNHAPALNGSVNHVYSDGRILYTQKFNESKKRKEKRKYAEFVVQLYEEEKFCFPEREVVPIPNEIVNYKY